MPRKKVHLRSVPPPRQKLPLRSVPAPRVKLRSVPAPPRPRKVIAKKTRFADLSDVLISRILSLCNARDVLRGRCLHTIREAFALALTCSRNFAIFRNRLQVVDAVYPALRGYPSAFFPGYLSPTQMTWIARLAQGRLQVLRLPFYSKGTTDVLVAVEYCCHYIQQLGFTDGGMVFPNLACSLFTACNKISQIEIRAPQKSTIQAMCQSRCAFKEILLLDVDTDFSDVLCTLVESKGKHVKLLQIAFAISPADNGLTEEEEGRYGRIQDFGNYLTEHGMGELPKLEVLDISTCSYHLVDHDAWDVLDDDERPGIRLLKVLKKEVGRKNARNIRQIDMIRVRSGNIEFAECMVLNHIPLYSSKKLQVMFPGGSLIFDTNERSVVVNGLQLGMHLRHGKDCITRETRNITSIDLGNQHFVMMYYKDEHGLRSKVAKVLLQECGNIKTIRGVFNLSKDEQGIKMAYIYITKVMKFAMLVTSLDITYEMIMYGHVINDDFLAMVYSWSNICILRLVNPGNYGTTAEKLSENDCVTFASGLQWLLVLLPRACRRLRVVYLEDLGAVEVWNNAPASCNCLKWAVDAVETFENLHLVDCGTLKATLRRWLANCINSTKTA